MTNLERVRDAIIGTMFAPHELPLSDELLARYSETACAAVEALREPSETMIDAMAGSPTTADERGIWASLWLDGINAILAEKP